MMCLKKICMMLTRLAKRHSDLDQLSMYVWNIDHLFLLILALLITPCLLPQSLA